jgi:hypothetical protein
MDDISACPWRKHVQILNSIPWGRLPEFLYIFIYIYIYIIYIHSLLYLQWHAIFAMRSRLCNLCYAMHTICMLCKLCYATYAIRFEWCRALHGCMLRTLLCVLLHMLRMFDGCGCACFLGSYACVSEKLRGHLDFPVTPYLCRQEVRTSKCKRCLGKHAAH